MPTFARPSVQMTTLEPGVWAAMATDTNRPGPSAVAPPSSSAKTLLESACSATPIVLCST